MGDSKSMRRKVHPDFKRATKLIHEGQARKALLLAQGLIASTVEMDRLDGYTCQGMAFEDGGVDLDPDFDRSLDSYRRASLIAPNAVSFIHLARISLKRKDYPSALRFLNISAEYEETPEVLLGFGHYFEDHLPKEASNAKSYFMKAALRGRFDGFFGYSRVARKLGQTFRAFLMDCCRVVSGPFIALAIGVRAQFKF
ncbi:hypothetical protein [Stenotrophomonas sp. 278]|uniref:hypothetical protein n=1 Tax=Stenotrophomonas sp. 278 TaxID=2479851 RepID=UPI000F67598D|nr:hypothetical protein [Stenotrophomonas sp. 278]